MLKERRERFCNAIVEGDTAGEAYRKCYAAPKASQKSINERASRLLAEPEIAARIEELRAPVREKAQLTLEVHLDKLATLRDKAEERESWSAAITAEVSRGKAAGLYVERSELTGKNGTPLNLSSMTREEREQQAAQLIHTLLTRRKQKAS